MVFIYHTPAAIINTKKAAKSTVGSGGCRERENGNLVDFLRRKMEKRVRIDPKVKYIHEGAFRGFTSLQSIEIPDTVTFIEPRAFAGCTSLSKVIISPSSKLTSIGDGAFSGCTSLTNFDMPCGVGNIGQCCFQGCTSLSSLYIPSSITTIRISTFRECKSLCTISIPSVVEVKSAAFQDCSSLSTIHAPLIITIWHKVFQGCSSLRRISLHNVTSCGNSVFRDCISLTHVDMPLVMSVNKYTFRGCTSLTHVSMPKVKIIGQVSFEGCISLHNVDMPQVTAIQESAFRRCSSLKHLYMPLLSEIGSQAFRNATSLTRLMGMPKIIKLGVESFRGCQSLEIFYYNSGGLSFLSWNVFADCPNLVLLTEHKKYNSHWCDADLPILNPQDMRRCIDALASNDGDDDKVPTVEKKTNEYENDPPLVVHDELQEKHMDALQDIICKQCPRASQRARQSRLTILHFLVYFQTTNVHDMVHQLLSKYPLLTTTKDMMGYSPLDHVMLQCSKDDHLPQHKLQVYKLLSQGFGNKIVHQILESKLHWNVKKAIVSAKIDGLVLHHEVSGLLPFMYIAESELFNQMYEVTHVYELLILRPDVLEVL